MHQAKKNQFAHNFYEPRNVDLYPVGCGARYDMMLYEAVKFSPVTNSGYFDVSAFVSLTDDMDLDSARVGARHSVQRGSGLNNQIKSRSR